MVINKALLALVYADALMRSEQARKDARESIPEGAMRVAPGSDAVVWRINSDRCGEL